MIDQDFSCLSVTGNIDALTAPQLQKEIVAALTAPRSRCLLDLSKVDYMSSAGLRVLVVGARAADSIGGAFAICNVQGAVKKVLAAVGFSARIAIYETQKEAVAAIRKRLE